MAAMSPVTVQLNIFAWNQKLTKYVKYGQLEKAMQLFQQMQQEGMSPDKFTFVPVIKEFAGLGRLEDGDLIINSSFKVVTSPMSLCARAWWTCMQNVGALRRLGQCLRRCHLEMLSLGPPSY